MTALETETEEGNSNAKNMNEKEEGDEVSNDSTEEDIFDQPSSSSTIKSRQRHRLRPNAATTKGGGGPHQQGRTRTRHWHFYVYWLTLHVICASVYLIPMFVWKSPLDQGQPVLDELHIVTLEHGDIYPTTTNHDKNHHPDNSFCSGSNEHKRQWLSRWWWCGCYPWVQRIIQHDPVWTNDYWGRPMSSPSSHKSWRPLSVLSFRYLRFPKLYGYFSSTSFNNNNTTIMRIQNDLDNHRLVNVLLHTLTAEFVALLAVLLLKPMYQNYHSRRKSSSLSLASSSAPATTTGSPSPSSFVFLYTFWVYTWTKLLFTLHPTHVEVTANAANRPHLIATAAMCFLANPNIPYTLFVLVLLIGFLSAETFLFGILPATGTMLLIQYQQQIRQEQQQKQLQAIQQTHDDVDDNSSSSSSLMVQTMKTIRYCGLRILTFVLASLLYYGGRHSLDWLSIPNGLIRPAENPYFRLRGWERVVNYAYITALHVAKSWDLDWVGFSHEYGFQCLTPIAVPTTTTKLLSSWDIRLSIPLALVVGMIGFPVIWFWGMGQYRAVVDVLVQEPTSSSTTTSESDSTTDSSEQQSTGMTLESKPPQQNEQDQDQHPSTTDTLPTPVQPQTRRKKTICLWSSSFLLWLFHLSWLATLFPITGIVKVGTFVADRIVVPSSVSVCILVAHGLSLWFTTTTEAAAAALAALPPLKKSSRKRRKQQARQSSSTSPTSSFPFFVWWLLSTTSNDWWQVSDARRPSHSNSSSPSVSLLSLLLTPNWRWWLVLSMIAAGWRRIHQRTWEWMDSLPLLQSSLQTCPRSAKSHLEMSKIYSGLYADYYNLTQATWHLQQVEDIDPTNCDVHYQYVHIALQDPKADLLFLEERLTKAIPCPFTMGGALHMWKQYWNIATSAAAANYMTMGGGGSSVAVDPQLMIQSAYERQEQYRQEYLREAKKVEEQQKQDEEEQKQGNSPLVNSFFARRKQQQEQQQST